MDYGVKTSLYSRKTECPARHRHYGRLLFRDIEDTDIAFGEGDVLSDGVRLCIQRSGDFCSDSKLSAVQYPR